MDIRPNSESIISMSHSFIEKYLCGAFTYSALRKLYYTYDSQYVQLIDNKIETRPILYSHRVVHALFAGIMGVGLAPAHFLNDVERVELCLRNIKPFPIHDRKYHNDTDFYTVLWDQHKASEA